MKKRLISIITAVVLIVFILTSCMMVSRAQAATTPPVEKPEKAATLVLKNGAIYTIDEKESVVTAVAANDGEIIYVGDDAGVEPYINESTKVIDLKGKMVTPGFINGHDHIAIEEVSKKATLVLSKDNPSIEKYKKALTDYAKANQKAEALMAIDMDLNVYGDDIPNNTWLNEAVPDIPVVIKDVSNHGRLLNDAALKICGITNATPTPDKGTIFKDDAGNITGYFSDCSAIAKKVEDLIAVTPEQFLEAFDEFQKLCASYGVTAMNDGGASGLPVVGADAATARWEALLDHSKAGKMTMRVAVPRFGGPLNKEGGEKMVAILDEYSKKETDDVRFGQIKITIDGVPEGKSALLMEPYAPEAGMDEDYVGPVPCTQEDLNDFVEVIDAAGYQVLTHSMGDGACHMSVQAFDNAAKANGKRDARHVIVHATLMDPADIKKAGELGVYAATQPVWFYVEPQFGALELQMFGEERFWREYVARDMVDAGMTLTGSADYAVTTDFRPLTGIEIGVTQGSPYPDQQGKAEFVRNKKQVLSVMEMLKVYTINCAKQAFMEDIVGSIEVGKKADFVVLAQDITKIDPLDISETEIVQTIFDGKIIYES